MFFWSFLVSIIHCIVGSLIKKHDFFVFLQKAKELPCLLPPHMGGSDSNI